MLALGGGREGARAFIQVLMHKQEDMPQRLQWECVASGQLVRTCVAAGSLGACHGGA